mmetsp:Transcript_40447/g.127330  ORF Transcript_40447/g.127330 Transcript_40447/m.127330 type:complete len:239 (+) Transcript_40447:1079-1795(+)
MTDGALSRLAEPLATFFMVCASACCWFPRADKMSFTCSGSMLLRAPSTALPSVCDIFSSTFAALSGLREASELTSPASPPRLIWTVCEVACFMAALMSFHIIASLVALSYDSRSAFFCSLRFASASGSRAPAVSRANAAASSSARFFDPSSCGTPKEMDGSEPPRGAAPLLDLLSFFHLITTPSPPSGSSEPFSCAGCSACLWLTARVLSGRLPCWTSCCTVACVESCCRASSFCESF